MDDTCEKPDKKNAFDALFSTNHLQMYKILLPYLPPKLQIQLAVYIKYEELTYTVSFLSKHQSGIFTEKQTPDIDSLCNELSPYCSFVEKNRLTRIKELINNINNAKEMMEMLNMMKEMFPEGMSFTNESDACPDIKNLMPDNIKEILNMLGK